MLDKVKKFVVAKIEAVLDEFVDCDFEQKDIFSGTLVMSNLSLKSASSKCSFESTDRFDLHTAGTCRMISRILKALEDQLDCTWKAVLPVLAFDFTAETNGLHQVSERIGYITHKVFILVPHGFSPVEVTVFDRAKLSLIASSTSRCSKSILFQCPDTNEMANDSENLSSSIWGYSSKHHPKTSRHI